MSEAVVAAVLRAVDTEAPRAERAKSAAEIVREARGYQWAGIFDVGDDEIVLIGESGQTARDAAINRADTIAPRIGAVVPVLGAESAIVIGTLEVESDTVITFGTDDVAFLEECAGALRPLYD